MEPDFVRERLRAWDLAWAPRLASEAAALEAPESLPELRRKRPTLLETEEKDLRKLLVVEVKEARLEGVGFGGRSASVVGTLAGSAPVCSSAGVSATLAGGDALVLSASGCLTTTGRALGGT